MDDAERAQAHEEMFRDIAQNHRKPTLRSVGHCYFCDETVQRGVLFCSKDCAFDYEQEERIRQIIGRVQGHA